MLMEGYGKIEALCKLNAGYALIEFAAAHSANDALPIAGSKIPGPFLHNRRLQVTLCGDPKAPMPRAMRGGRGGGGGGGGGGGMNEKNFGTHLPGSLRQDKTYAPSYQLPAEHSRRWDLRHRRLFSQRLSDRLLSQRCGWRRC